MKPHHQDPSVVIATRDEAFRSELEELVSGPGSLAAASDASTTLALLGRLPSARLLIIAEASGDSSSLDLLEAAKASFDHLAVLILSTQPTIERATEAIRRGAEDFVAVPYSKELLRKEVDRILEAAELRDRVAQLRNLVAGAYGFEQIVSNARCMRTVFERALAASRTDTPVLLSGETGTGKELIAGAIHANSRRCDRPFVPVNCAALPRDLVESELFGHRRGAFSGAHADHLGLFVAAHNGTLLLDEVSELAPEAQAKLLRVLQSGEVRPVGGLESRSVAVRIIAATNRRVRELRDGALRRDLFFRLSVVVIEIPPLRERREDIPYLVEHFLGRYGRCGSGSVCSVEPEALNLLANYPFRGNVRELENLVHSLCTTVPPGGTTIAAKDVRAWLRRQGPVGGWIQRSADGVPLNLRELEAWAIHAAIEQANGNKSRAAVLLGISRDTLYRKLLEFEVPRHEVVRISDRRRIFQ